MSRRSTDYITTAALDWAASGRTRPPREIAELPTGDQVALYREARQVLSETHDCEPRYGPREAVQ